MFLGDDKARHDRMVEPVETMLKLHKDLPKARRADGLRPTAYGPDEDEVRDVQA